MNKANFGFDCQNNIGNCKFTVLYDQTEEVSYIQKYVSLDFNEAYKDFTCPIMIKEQIERQYNRKPIKIETEDLRAETKKYSHVQKRASKIDAVDFMVAKKVKKKTFKDCDQSLGKV